MALEHADLVVKMTALVRTFPSLRDAPGLSPWDANILDQWAAETPLSHGELVTARFVLAVWDPDQSWECGRFDVMEALRVWDAKHRAAFRAGQRIRGGRDERDRQMNDELLPVSTRDKDVVGGCESELPALVARAGDGARFAWDEFFAGELPNRHTRTAYLRAAQRFLAWCESRGLELHTISPGLVGQYFGQHSGSVPTKKQHLAALRRLFDRLVVRHIVVLNPAASVRVERYQLVEGKTPEIGVEQARKLLRSIETSHVVGLRDRAAIGVLIYTAVRAGAVAALRRKDFVHDGTQWTLRFFEKGGKVREIPVRHDLERFLLDYLSVAGIEQGAPTSPLFRTAVGKTRILTTRALCAADVWRLVKRRLKDANLSVRFSPHSFRATTITDLLEQGVPFAEVQYLAGHADPRTTRLYDRRQRRVTRNVVERISI